MTLPTTHPPRLDASAPRVSRLIAALDDATEANPVSRKRLIGPDVNWGRELLVALARRRGGWIGWEATNLREIADELALVGLAMRGLRAAGDVEISAIVGTALDEYIETGAAMPGFAALRHSLGFRELVRDAVLELRTAGITAAQLRNAAPAGSAAYDVAGVLERYIARLAAHDIADPAGVIEQALADFDAEAPFVLDGEMHVASALVARGLAGRLLERLLAHGARLLAADPVTDSPPPGTVAIDFFAAATPSDELCEVFRRVMAEGLRWDDVEIIATDTDSYGIALDALCQRLALGATMLHGVPFARTRLGRALDRWFAWLEDGLPADTLRQALEAGELRLPGDDAAPTALGRELRWQRIGWGRSRYDAAIQALALQSRKPQFTRYEDEPDEEYAARVESRRRAAAALHSLLTRLFAVVPPVPERGSTGKVRTTTAALACATRGWLDLFDAHGEAEQATKSRLDTRLAEIAAIADPETGFSTALAALRLALADLRAWPMITAERHSWSSHGGMVHLTDLAHAGTTGRPRIFVVGLDAERTVGGKLQDPLLTESIRTSLGEGLATLHQRRVERLRMVAAALAGLRGRVTLSYATSGSLDGREAAPAPALLQAWRIARGDLSQTYESLRKALQPPACAVPEYGVDGAAGRAVPEDGVDGAAGRAVPLDARDVWLGTLAEGALLLDATELLREGFSALAAGEAARAALRAEAFSEHLGRSSPAEELLTSSRGLSPTALEKLSSCPLAWFYQYGIGLRPPQDPEYDPERWLDPKDRGSALHAVYERFVTRYLGRRSDIVSPEAQSVILGITDDVIADFRERVPPPSTTVFDSEAAELRRAALVFLLMERAEVEAGDGGEWERVEVEFGGSAGEHRYRAGSRSLPIIGRADRVDRMHDGSLRVVDYKTGSASRYIRSKESALFHGGRHLQPALYAEAVAQVAGSPVARFEYRFPTEKGDSTIVGYEAAELAEAASIVASLLRHVEQGWFVPTDDDGDCRYCDYRAICRVHESGGRHTRVHSPRARWAKDHGEKVAELALMRANRGSGETAG